MYIWSLSGEVYFPAAYPFLPRSFPYLKFSGRFQERFACDYKALARGARLSGRIKAIPGPLDTNCGAAGS
jgi:hypothetical protein